MPRKTSSTLTDGELRLMRVLWDKGRATVAEVVDALPETTRPAYNSVLTLLRVLERKGYVRHEKIGRAFEYYPLLAQGRARQHAVRELLRRFFDDSPELLVSNLLREKRIRPDDLDRLRDLFDEHAEKGGVS